MAKLNEMKDFIVNHLHLHVETKLKEKKQKVEDALNAKKAAVEEGVVVGGGCTLLRLVAKVDSIKETLGNDELEVGSDIVKRALGYPMKLTKNADCKECWSDKPRKSSSMTKT
ncbi:RuBisCO large subunit-binding protein subunit beta, chloroplastic [Tanacetum coccineum]